jgi:hypothetical protein
MINDPQAPTRPTDDPGRHAPAGRAPPDRLLSQRCLSPSGSDRRVELSGRRRSAVVRPTRQVQQVRRQLTQMRLALTREQVDDYHLPVIIKHDRRYTDGRPHEAVETEALRQTVLVDILRARLTALLPEPLARVLERERRQRAAIQRLPEH